MTALASLLLVLSGIAALSYQVVWVRLLRLSLGSTSASVATVVAAFFVGMTMGSWLAGRIGRRGWLPYVGMEAGIAAGGALLLPALLTLNAWIPDSVADGILGRFLISWVLLAIPTACMGATFPYLVNLFDGSRARLSSFYAWNTLGAVLGALATAFWFIPSWGLDGATRIAVALNLGVALVALVASRIAGPPPQATSTQPTGSTSSGGLAVLLVTGFASIACEVAWSRLLAMTIGGTIFGFAIILALFLTGITLGSFAVRWIPPDRPDRWLGIGLGVLACTVLASRGLLSWTPAAEEGIVGRVVRMLVVMAPSTLVFGALYPVAMDRYSGGSAGRIGRANALNLLSGVAGSLGAGFWLLPRFGTDVTLALCGAVAWLSGAAFLLIRRSDMALAGLLAGGALLLWVGPRLDLETIVGSVHYSEGPGESADQLEFLYMREGQETLVSLATRDGNSVVLQANGLDESVLNRSDPQTGPTAETLLAWVPWLMHVEARSAFVIGYGGGVTTRALLDTPIQRVDVAELEPVMVDAVAFLYGAQLAGLEDPRLHLEFADARHRLQRRTDRYDILVSQPSHPWLSGGSSLFTLEFFRLVRSRLAEGGLFGQWLNLFNMDATTCKAVLRSFYEVFEYGFVMADPSAGDLLMFGSSSPLRWDIDQIDARLDRLQATTLRRSAEIEDAVDLLRFHALSRRQAIALTADAEPNTDRNLRSELRLAGLRLRRGPLPTAENPYLWLREESSFDLEPLVGHALAAVLEELAGDAIEREDRAVARRAIGRLYEIDSDRARHLDAALRLPPRTPGSAPAN